MLSLQVRPVVLTAAVVVCTVFLLSAGVFAQGLASETVVQIDPAEQSVSIGQNASVDVFVTDVADLYGADVRLTFDPSLLAVVDTNPGLPGVQVTLGPLLTGSQYFAIRNEADNATGTIWVALTQLNPAPPVTGSGIFMRLTFHTLMVGAADVHLAGVSMADRNGLEIPVSIQHGLITATPLADHPFTVRLPIVISAY